MGLLFGGLVSGCQINQLFLNGLIAIQNEKG
jgi:hypothetical protein